MKVLTAKPVQMPLLNFKLILIPFLSLLSTAITFTVYWNVPSQQCQRNYGHDFTELLSTYGILVNDGDKFQGNCITLFYEAQLGFYPHILKNGTFINGGIPQAGYLPKHLKRAAQVLENTIPSKDFDGIGVIDWEAWRPSWNFNWAPSDIYREASIDYARKYNPHLDKKSLEKLAKTEWAAGSKSYMLETLLLAKKLRPLAKWGFYLFPDCYNYKGEKPEDFECSKDVKADNDRLSWLWKSSTSLHPSIYLKYEHLDRYTLEQRSWKDDGKLKETMRVATADTVVLPYVNHFLDEEVVPKGDFRRMVAQTASVGANGLVIWGSSASINSRTRCDGLKDYIINTLGPTIERVSWNSNICSKRICNGNGQCTWPNDPQVTAWNIFLDDVPDFKPSDITCRCKSNYIDRFCQKKA